MRSQLVFSALVLSAAAINACSAQSDSTPPRDSGTAGTSSTTNGTGGTASSGTAGSTSSTFGGQTSSGTAGSSSSTFGGQTSTGFGGTTSTSTGGTPTTGAGGSTTTAAGCSKTTVGTGSNGLIDNFDTHPTTGLIPATDGRVGGWWVSKSATATVTPMANAAPDPVADPLMSGNYALELKGTDPGTDPNAAWGADASVAITATGACYDASAYTGGIKVKMWGKGGVFVSVITAEDKAASATSGNQRTDISLTTTPTVYTIPWSMLATGWGNPIPLDLKEVVALDFAPDATSAASFDIWVDDVTLY